MLARDARDVFLVRMQKEKNTINLIIYDEYMKYMPESSVSSSMSISQDYLNK